MPWRSKKHHDGTIFDGWFIAGLGKEKGVQISYHIPLERWEELDNFGTFSIQELDKAPEWDGHTSTDVIERIKKYLY